MFKKSLIIGSVTLILLAFFALAGCSNPAGSNGPQGRDGTLVLNAPTLGAGDLAEYFDDAHIIKLTGTGSVDGVVPPGKTLQIAGTVTVTGAEVLTIDGGTVHILNTGALSIIDGTDGTIEQNSGSLVIEGDLVLAATDDTFFENGVPGWIAFGATGAVDLQGAAASVINANFGYGVPAIKASTTTLLDTTDMPDLTNWIGGRKLIVYGALNSDQVLDLTNRGPLVVGVANSSATAGALTIDQVTDQGALLVSRGGGSIIVNDGASLILTATGWLPTNIPITVYGNLAAGSATIDVPTNVDLRQGTLTAVTTFTPTFTFGPRTVEIAKIALPNTAGSITINGVEPSANAARQPVTLYVGSITTGTAAGTLNLPAGTTTVDRIITGTTILTLGSSANGHEADPPETVKTVLRPSIIAGGADVVLVRGARLDLQGRIDLSNTLVLDQDNLGSDWTGQLAQIIGGSVSTRNDHLVLGDGAVLNTQLFNGGEIDISGTVTFNRSANLFKVTVTAPATVAGRGTFALVTGGSLVVNDDVTFSIKGFGTDPGVAFSRTGTDTGIITIADEKSIIIGQESQFAVGSYLTLNPGQYKATGLVTITSTNGTSTTIVTNTPPAADNGLTISPAGDETNKITLFSDGGTDVATFTVFGPAATGPVVFDKDGIIIPAGGTGANIKVTGATNSVGEITVAGTSTITLGTSATVTQKGFLSLDVGAKLTAADVTNGTFTSAASFTAETDFDKALTPTLSVIDIATTGVKITTKAPAGDAQFTSTTIRP